MDQDGRLVSNLDEAIVTIAAVASDSVSSGCVFHLADVNSD